MNRPHRSMLTREYMRHRMVGAPFSALGALGVQNTLTAFLITAVALTAKRPRVPKLDDKTSV